MQLLAVRPKAVATTNAQIVTLDRIDDSEVTLRFLSAKRDGGYGRREVRLDTDVAEQLLTMLVRELDGDVEMG
jgi:hypothetical protein